MTTYIGGEDGEDRYQVGGQVLKRPHVTGIHDPELDGPDEDQPKAVDPHNFLGP